VGRPEIITTTDRRGQRPLRQGRFFGIDCLGGCLGGCLGKIGIAHRHKSVETVAPFSAPRGDYQEERVFIMCTRPATRWKKKKEFDSLFRMVCALLKGGGRVGSLGGKKGFARGGQKSEGSGERD
jgi:hypothetical protein